MKQICVIGVGYVGIVTAACFADLGNRVIALDINEEKIEGLKRGEMPIYEPGLKELVERNVRAGRLIFYHLLHGGPGWQRVRLHRRGHALRRRRRGRPALRGCCGALHRRVHERAPRSSSTSPPCRSAQATGWPISSAAPAGSQSHFSVVSCPEFLREGSAISDFMQPHRTVLGSLDREAAEKVAQLHLPLRAPIVITDLRTAEMIKYASNAFLATKISFINEIANICEALGADVKEVAAGMGYDRRIGQAFLDAGLGYGGSCFPKDVKALAYHGSREGPPPAAPARRDGDQRRPPSHGGQPPGRDARRPARQDHRPAGSLLQAQHR